MSDGIFGRILDKLRAGPPSMNRDRFDDLSPELPDADAGRVAAGLQACLMGSGGRVAVQGRVVALGHAYLALGADGRRRFLEIVARAFAADGASTLAAVADLDEFGEWRGLFGRHRMAAEALEPPRWRLLGMFGEIHGGDRLLMQMRDDLGEAAHAELAADLDRVLSSRR